jgi:hypothetical protein
MIRTCFYCGKKTDEGKVCVSNPNEFVCYDCWENHPRCSSCNNLLPPGGQYYKRPDGKKICVSCNLVEEKEKEKNKGEAKFYLALLFGTIVVIVIIYVFYGMWKKQQEEGEKQNNSSLSPEQRAEISRLLKEKAKKRRKKHKREER